MTTNEKANDLIEKMKFKCIECDYEFNAKQCALILVDELIAHCNYINKWYWEEVKQQIKLL